VNDIIAKYPEYQTLLDDYVAQQTGTKPSSYAQASSEFLAFTPAQQRPLLLNVFFDDLKTTGRDANASASAGFGRGYDAINALFPGSGAGETGQPPSPYLGDISLAFSRIYTVAGGNISILTPGGLVDVGLAFPPTNANPKLPSQLGIVAQGSGDVDIFSQNDVRVNASRVFTLGGGNILIWSTLGNIDAGRGAKSAVSAPPPVVTLDPVTGVVTVSFTGAVAGSGIRTIISGDDIAPGDVDLIAPVGFVNAGDAGIGSSGNLNIAAKQVVGVDNIQVGGTATGVPPPTSGIAATLSSASSAANSATTASSAVSSEESANKDVASASQAAMSWLDVFLVGLGEDNCSPEDQQCLERQKSSTK
ncbi:MAG TPA: filamentous hemagglutinin family protein, partial [Steroidobacteraceae bacterium]|nr:filamentous hemagglutinin family protein [Steroidobacteraceae bacterium]